MFTPGRLSSSSTLTRLALLGALLSIANLAGAQATPAPPASYPGQAPPAGAQPAPVPAQQPPATYAPPAQDGAATGYQTAPPPAGYTPQPSPLYQPAPSPASAPPGYHFRPTTRPKRGMMIAGIALLGSSYLVATSIGVEYLDRDRRDCDDCRDIAPWLFIPVIGPFISMSQTDDDWGFWMLGMLESVGTGLLIGGIVRFRNSKQASELQHLSQWKLPGNRLLSLDLSTSARFAGPRMRLDF